MTNGSDEAAGKRPPAGGTKALAVVYGTVFLDLLGFGIILPYLPYWARELGASGFELGLVLSAYSGAQLFGAAVFGRLSDHHGRRPILLLTLAGSSAAMVACALAPNLLLLAFARGLAGLFGGSISTAQAYVADVTGPADRARYMGLLGAAIGIGFVLGPALGGGLYAAGLSFPQTALVAAGLAATNLLLALLLVKETRERTARRRSTSEVWRSSLSRSDLGPVLVGTLLITLAFVSMETTFAYYAQDHFGLSAGGFAATMVGLGLVLVAVQAGLIGPLTASFGLRTIALVGVASMAVALIVIPLTPGLPAALAALAVLAAGRGLASPTMSALVSRGAAADEQGTVLGVGQSMQALARAVGPLIAGSLYDLRPAAPYFFAATTCVLATGLLTRLTTPAPGDAHAVESS